MHVIWISTEMTVSFCSIEVARIKEENGLVGAKLFLTPIAVSASISFSMSGQCCGHSLLIISTTMRDRASLIWHSSSKIGCTPWNRKTRHIEEISQTTHQDWTETRRWRSRVITTPLCSSSTGLSPAVACYSTETCEPAARKNSFKSMFSMICTKGFHLLDHMFQDLQAKVSDHCSLRSLRQPETTLHTERTFLFELFNKLQNTLDSHYDEG